MRSLTPLELAIAVAVTGSVLAASVPPFLRNLHASRLAEPIDGLGRIAARASALAERSSAYPESAPLTPDKVPQGEAITDPPGTWNHGTWQALEFEFTVPHHYSFAFDSRNTPERAMFHARAQGDLDGDGMFSTFAISGEQRPGATPTISALDVHREVE